MVACAGHATIDYVVHREEGMLRMIATGVSVGPSAALAAFQLFDFLVAGEFRPRQGLYTITAQQHGDASGHAADLDAASMAGMNNGAGGLETTRGHRQAEDGGGDKQEETRFFVSCELLRHPGLKALDYGSLFCACRGARKVFDMETRTGTSFAVPDTAAAGALGVVSTGATLCDAFSDLAHTLEFVHRAALHADPGAAEACGEYQRTMGAVCFVAERLQALVHRRQPAVQD
jgi:hypothetical protein